ncbi:MAG: hypothetical protein ACNY01_12215 [Desulfobacteria bacterium]
MTDMVQTIKKIAVAQQQLARQAEQQYFFEVESILRDQCREPQRIERLLDGMLDFCFDDKMLRLYKMFCRYYLKIDPMATASYVYADREMWDEVKPVEFDGVRMQAGIPPEFERFRREAGNNYFVLANIEGMNAKFIHMGLTQGVRIKRLNEIAIRQMKTLTASNTRVLEDGK